MKVWVAYSGDYEQRSAFAAFATEELARQYSDDVEEMDVFDRPVRTVQYFTRWVEIQESVARDHFPKRVSLKWPEWLGPDFDRPISRADVHHYNANPYNGHPEHRWVIVEGADEAAVDAEVLRLVAGEGATYEPGYAVGWGPGFGTDWNHRHAWTEAIPYDEPEPPLASKEPHMTEPR